MNFDITENWDIKNESFLNLFPLIKMIDIVEKPFEICIARDDEILNINVEAYNLPIFSRAFDQDLNKRGMERVNIHKYMPYLNDPKLRKIFSINLPQVLLYDNFGYEEPIISIHLAKIRKDEWFINDIIVKKTPNNFMKNNMASLIIKNVIQLAQNDNAKYLSGYAMNKKVSDIMKNKGFTDDKRKELGHDWIHEMARLTGMQFPIYMKL